MKLDSAVQKALSLDPAETSVSAHGGSGFTSTAKVTTVLHDGSLKHFFMKTGSGKDKAIMFEGEHRSLAAIHDVVPSLSPASLAFGELEGSPGCHFLVTDFVELRSKKIDSEEGSGLTFAQKLAILHTTPVPPPEGFTKPMFGFPVVTCCGDTPQPNDYKEDWAEFYAENRLLAILERGEANNGPDAELRAMTQRTVNTVVPRLLRKGHLGAADSIEPVVIHGDLWSGNMSHGRIAGRGAVEDLIFDPSACWAHSEFELGIMRMFGGFGAGFLAEYHQLNPKTEPAAEYDDRISLYELYHHLNHNAIFGGSYRSGAVAIMQDLLRKYAT